MTLEQFADWIEPAWLWWTGLFADVPEYPLAVSVYLGGGVLALWLWSHVARRMPRMLGGLSWLIMFAVLFSPTVTEGDNGQIAPAVIGLIFGIITKDAPLIFGSLLPMLFVVGIGCLVGFFVERWQQHLQEDSQDHV